MLRGNRCIRLERIVVLKRQDVVTAPGGAGHQYDCGDLWICGRNHRSDHSAFAVTDQRYAVGIDLWSRAQVGYLGSSVIREIGCGGRLQGIEPSRLSNSA